MQMEFRIFGRKSQWQIVRYHTVREIISGSIRLASSSRDIWSKRYLRRPDEHWMITKKVQWEHGHTGINKPSHGVLITCSKAVLDLEANPLQLFITEETNPHEASTGEDESRTGWATEAIDQRRKAEGTIPHLDVVEATLKWRFDVEGLIKQQLYPLAGQGWGKQSGGSHWLPQRWFKDIMLVKNVFSPFKFFTRESL